MLVFYVDECGDTSLKVRPKAGPPELKAGVSPWFVLAAVGVRDSSRKLLAEALVTVKKKHLGGASDDAPWADTEIKGRYLARAARSAAAGKSLRSPVGYRGIDTEAASEALALDLGRIFARFRPMVFAVAVDKSRMVEAPNPQHPLGAAYAYLQQRVAMTLDQVHEGEGALFVADQQLEHEAYFRSGAMNAARDHMMEPRKKKPDFRRLLDKPLWVDTELSTWDREIIQLSDIVAYSVSACVTRGKWPEEPHYVWGAIRGCFARNWRDGRIPGGGLAIYPAPKAFPKM